MQSVASPTANERASIISRIRELQNTLTRKREFASEHATPLSFVVAPLASRDGSATQSIPRELNTGLYALRYEASVNNHLLSYEEWLLKTIQSCEAYSRSPIPEVRLRYAVLQRNLEVAITDFEQWKAEEWRRQLQNPMIDTADAPSNGTVVQPHRFDTDDKQFKTIASSIPSDVRLVITTLDLSPQTITFVCCPRCFALYRLQSSEEDDQYPKSCQERKANGSPPCSAQLRITRTIRGVDRTFPARRFRMQDFDDWLGRTLCRPGLETVMDSRTSTCGVKEAMADIRDAPILDTILLPNGEKFVGPHVMDEGRYTFSICMDGLNPRGKGGPPVSVCSIFLACLDLPPNMRYKQENMFLVAVIPGPRHPSKEQINYLLKPIVTTFHRTYQHGVFYSRTPNFPRGKMTRSALVLPIGDSLAYAQMMGCAPPTHTHFCPFCLLTVDKIEDLDWQNWPTHDSDRYLSIAKSWLEAETEEDRAAIYKVHGIRWSELLRLPYWDPTKFRTIDIMHNLYSGVLAHHIVSIWGISSELQDGLEGVTFDPSKRKVSADERTEGRRVLQFGTDHQLDKLLKPVLRQLCREEGLRFSGRKGKLLKRLHNLRSERHWPEAQSAGQPSKTRPRVRFPTILDDQEESPPQQVDPVDLMDIHAGDPEGECSYETRVLPQHTPHRSETDRRTRSKRNEPATDDEMTRGRSVLERGSKSELRTLRVPVLRMLCSEVFHVPLAEYDEHSKEALLSALHQYRVENGICDEEGKVLHRSLRRLKQASVAELAAADNALEYGSKSKVKSLRVAQLVALCTIRLGKHYLNKKQAVDNLLEYRVHQGITDARGKLVEERRKGKRTRVIGKQRLSIVWKDMQTTILPSFITPAPITAGTKGQGNLGAAEWRSFCTINLPISLIALWGSFAEDSREYQLLANFMDLVTAVKLVSTRIITAQSLADYRTHLHSYLTNLLVLFPGTTINHNQHRALHIPEIFAHTGPAHAQWCFGFERGNHELQVINTNNQNDSIASTFLERFCNKQNIRHIFTGAVLPAQFSRAASLFIKAFSSDSGDLFDILGMVTSEDEDDDSTENDASTQLSREIAECLHDKTDFIDGITQRNTQHIFVRRVEVIPFITERGFKYKAAHRSPRDSYIAFRTGEQQRWRAGRIAQIFRHSRRKPSGIRVTEVFLDVEEYRRLDDGEKMNDPYRKFPLFGKLFRDEFLAQHTIVTVAELWCHCAISRPAFTSEALKAGYIHALPLDKVSPMSTTECYIHQLAYNWLPLVVVMLSTISATHAILPKPWGSNEYCNVLSLPITTSSRFGALVVVISEPEHAIVV
ncbi:hypothetical protein NM688_g7722 [Phlebia brevispora]|uniref:Uncharacterized protein n=1 Tax=Phlebia brevispora TaxID=194682 RepID=A0ACC1S257_9APHY|nr:hypothetical protein NM688_g7722 [Phlebia brevispora]